VKENKHGDSILKQLNNKENEEKFRNISVKQEKSYFGKGTEN